MGTNPESLPGEKNSYLGHSLDTRDAKRSLKFFSRWVWRIGLDRQAEIPWR